MLFCWCMLAICNSRNVCLENVTTMYYPGNNDVDLQWFLFDFGIIFDRSWGGRVTSWCIWLCNTFLHDLQFVILNMSVNRQETVFLVVCSILLGTCSQNLASIKPQIYWTKQIRTKLKKHKPPDIFI